MEKETADFKAFEQEKIFEKLKPTQLTKKNLDNVTLEEVFKLLEVYPANNTDDVLRNVIIIVCYSLIIVVSLIGNLLVCKVVFRVKNAKSNTNFLIGNLAISDLLMTAFNIPLNITRLLLDDWPFGKLLCIIVPFVQVTSAYVSTLTMIVIALDRYHRLNPNSIINLFNKYISIRTIVTIIWLLAFLLSLPHGIFNNVVQVLTWRKMTRCRIDYPKSGDDFRFNLTLFTVITQYLVPISLASLFYIQIGLFLWKKSTVGSLTETKRISILKKKRRRIKMMLFVVVAFAICWFPLNLYHILTDFGIINYNTSLFFLCHWFAMSSVCYNPFIYCWLNHNFKRDAKKLFACFFPSNQQINLHDEQIHLNRIEKPTLDTNEIYLPMQFPEHSKKNEFANPSEAATS